MEAKVSAKELMDVVRDTNEKVSAMVKKPTEKKAAEAVSKIGTLFVIQLMIVGIILAASIIFKTVLTEIGVVIPEHLTRIIYVLYAIVAVVVTALVKTNRPLKVVASIIAIAPMAISFILPLF